jgi:hypothetical protein
LVHRPLKKTDRINILRYIYTGGHSLRKNRLERLGDLNPKMQKYISSKVQVKGPVTNPNPVKSNLGRATKYDSNNNKELVRSMVFPDSDSKNKSEFINFQDFFSLF